uniref:Chromogranin-A n=1 Tax=Amphiprion ocellaris TaxID=80972 RepID=A0A3Q1CY50_AMPOC
LYLHQCLYILEEENVILNVDYSGSSINSVMKCIVEALADVLSRQQHVPVSQDCLETLKTDDRLVTILRHHNFLKELQEIAVQGESHITVICSCIKYASVHMKTRTISQFQVIRRELSCRKTTKHQQHKASLPAGKDYFITRSGILLMEEAEGRGVDVEVFQEENNKKNSLFLMLPGGERRDAPRNKSKEKRVNEEHEEEENKRSDVFSHKQQEKGEESPRRWTKRTKALQVKKKTVQQHEVPHHSKELTEEEEEEEQKKKKRGVNHKSPEEKELQMIARRPPEERRAMEEEGSASRKSEDPEIESLAAIESELENVAQKLHELRRG